MAIITALILITAGDIMFLWLWKWLRGYVRVALTGFSVERFLNMAAYRGIFLWDVKRSDAGAELCVSVKGFKRLRPALRKSKCRIRIREKHGLPFILHRYRRRKLLLGGVLFFYVGAVGAKFVCVAGGYRRRGNDSA